MIEPYIAVGLVPIMHGIRRRDEIGKNLEHVIRLAESFMAVSPTDRPVRLLTIPEGALQGFADEQLGLDHVEYARHCAIDIPGPETDALAALARKHSLFLMASAKARHPEFPDRFFNSGFLLSPTGDLLLRSYKLNPIRPKETSVSPHDVWDRWLELYGDKPESFFPVADTKIGRLGFMIGNDGSYPENARALALQGCEVVLRGPFAAIADDEIQNRARALDNNMYVIANHVGLLYLDGQSRRQLRKSMIVDPRGAVVAYSHQSETAGWVAATIDIEALRAHRMSHDPSSWLKGMRSEYWRTSYGEPIHPKNTALSRPPLKAEDYRDEVAAPLLGDLSRRGITIPPSPK